MADTNQNPAEGHTRRVEFRMSVRTIKLLNIVASVRDRSTSEVAEEILLRSLPAMTGEVASLAS